VLTDGKASPELVAPYQAYELGSAAFTAAFNPFSREVAADENHRQQEWLAKELTRRSLDFVEGVGQHPSADWPGEPSFLVFELEPEAAKSLGQPLKQNAIIWFGADRVPNLVLSK
jgi:hypothetical protein